MGWALNIVAAGAAWACAAGLAAAQPPDQANVQARLAQVAGSYAPDNAFMGAVLVARGDQVLLDKGYGQADLAWGLPNAPDVKFRIGSITKQFTAALVLMLRDEGKLSLADPVGRYLPDAPKAWDKVTLADLLGQTSGIPDFTADKRFHEWAMSPRASAELLAFFEPLPLTFEPGAKFSYSNSNYEVLGAVIEKVSGKSYADLLSERILKPLGMNDTGLDADDLILAKRAQGYRRGKDGLVQARSESLTVPWAAGAMYSTTGDLLRWQRGLYSGKLLSAASLAAMTTAGKGDYGLGLLVIQHDGQRVIWHNGGIEGFHAFLAYAPERQVTVAVLSNIDNGLPDVVGTQLLDVALGRPVFLAGEQAGAPIAAAELARFEGVYPLAPEISVVVAREGDHLVMKGPTRASVLVYEGLRNGHPTFAAPALQLDAEFVPGPPASVILHQGLMNDTVLRK